MGASATARQMRRTQRGFTMLEMLTIIAVLLTVAGIAIVNISSALRAAHVEDAYQMTLGQLRLARQTAIDKRTVCIVAFTAPGQISLTQAFADGTPISTTNLSLPQDAAFVAISGIPTAGFTPDGLGLGNRAIDFDQVDGGGGTAIYFQPDGSAQDVTGRTNDGVIYIAQPGRLMSSRAVTLLGTTGRLRGWRLISTGPGKVAWQ